MNGTQITFVGNLTADPELKYTPSGVAVCNLRVAVNTQTKQGDKWVDGEPTFYRVTVWRDYGEHAAETLAKGLQVLVIGKLQTRSWEGQDGTQRTDLEVTADELGPTLRWATAKVDKASSSGGQRSGPQGASKDFNDPPPF